MIRKAKIEDCLAISEIYNYYIENSVATFEETKLSGNEIERRLMKVENAGHQWLVAESNGKIIGYAYSSIWNERSAYRNTAEVSAYLDHDCVSKGIGTKLYDALFEFLRAKSIRIVIGGITLPNLQSVSLHQKFGMEQVAHFRSVGQKYGEWLDVGYWQVDLMPNRVAGSINSPSPHTTTHTDP